MVISPGRTVFDHLLQNWSTSVGGHLDFGLIRRPEISILQMHTWGSWLLAQLVVWQLHW